MPLTTHARPDPAGIRTSAATVHRIVSTDNPHAVGNEFQPLVRRKLRLASLSSPSSRARSFAVSFLKARICRAASTSNRTMPHASARFTYSVAMRPLGWQL
jgi:hypothetical protein